MKSPRQHVGVGSILVTLLFAAGLYGQVLPNPVPLISQPLVPTSVAPGSGALTIIVNGTGFVPPGFAPGSVVKWNGSPRTTTYVNSSQVTADILAADVATVGTASITVVSPTPGGGTSNAAFFHVTTPTTSVSMSKTDYATEQGSVSVTTGDFNGDGQLDLAVANGIIYTNDTVSILLGNGDGTFQTQTPFATGSDPYSVTTADFNADGKLDLAVVNSSALDNTVSILLGIGDGTFQAKVDFATGSIPTSVTTADFNADGTPDLAVANWSDSTVSILLGNGDGTFQAKVDFATDFGPYSVTTGDFNGDGKLDLAAASQNGDTVSILLGNGNGTFQANVDFPTGLTPSSVTTADFNADGKLDLAVANLTDDTVSILLGNGDGTFQAQTTFATGVNPFFVTAGDLNGDDKLDLAVSEISVGTVSILLGNGDGTFQTLTSFATGFFPDSVTTGDFNGDGKLDLATANDVDGTVSVLLQTVPAPAVQLSTTSLGFGYQLVGTTSAPTQVTLTNTGSAALNLSTINTQVAIGNTAASPDFASGWDSTSICFTSNVLPAGQSCVRNVTFTPSVPGLRTAVIAFNTDADTTPDYVSLSGTGLSLGVITPSVPNLDFGSHAVGTITTQTFTITNTGSGGMTMQGMTFTGNFALDAGTTTCPTSGPLASNASCVIGIKFNAYTLGANNGQLVITNDGAGNPFSLTLSGTGTAVQFAPGEVFAGANNQIQRRSATGSLIQVLNSGVGLVTGMAFDRSNNLYVTGVSSNVAKLDNVGSLQGNFVTGLSSAESIVFDAAGDAYIGDVSGGIFKFDPTGTTKTTILPGRADWIDLAADQKTMLFTQEGQEIHTVDVTTGVQGADFATGLGGSAFALRILRDGTVLVANGANILRLNSSGAVIQTYSVPSESFWFALNLDPDGTSFWSADANTSDVYKFDIASGNPLLNFNAGTPGGTWGLVVNGEITAANSTTLSLSTNSVNFPGNPLNLNCPTKDVVVTNTGNAPLTFASINITAPFSMAAGTTCSTSSSVASGSSCVLKVKFTPAVVGTVNGALTLTTNAVGSPHTEALSGTGTPACQLLAKVRVVTVLRGTEAQEFGIEDAKPSCSPVELSLTCSVENPAACLLTPAVIAPSGASTLRVTNLKRVGAESLVVEVTSTSEFRQAKELVTVRFADFAMTRSPEEAAVEAGGAASYALAVRPVNGLAGQVTFTCSGAPRGATCAVEPANITLDGASVAQVKVKVATSGGAALPMVNLPDDGARRAVPLLAVLLGLLMVGATRRVARGGRGSAPSGTGRGHASPLRWVLATAMLLMLLWASCGGGGVMNLAGGGTPAGRYALKVTGTYSSSSGPTPGTLSNSTTLNLKVN